jgi:uncharacterized repeat protein (TIGR03803 family)
MSGILDIYAKSLFGCGLALAMFAPFSIAHAQSFRVLYNFQGGFDGPDGAEPIGGFLADKAGNLYGVTEYGGDGCGTVFKLAPDGTETVLYAFKGGSDGCYPAGAPIEDTAGNLYGTTGAGGGTCPGENGGNSICGTIFRLAPDGTETVLYAFKGESDGFYPSGGLLLDKHGNLYGTTLSGGSFIGNSCEDDGCGTVFKLAPDGKKTILHTFTGDADGQAPIAPLIADKADNLYGATSGSNSLTCGTDCGTIFKLAPDGSETVLYEFCSLMNCADGSAPSGGLIADNAGDLYGLTDVNGANGGGTLFELAADGTETSLYSFEWYGPDGTFPIGRLVRDKRGNFYMATARGGKGCGRTLGCGTIVKVTPDGTGTVLHYFEKRTGDYPTGSLILINGYLYGTTQGGGSSSNCYNYGCGTVFAVKK